jgi:glycosyltransferase involved in cell wall biosynthesis
MKEGIKRICMIADTHGLYDDRIYWKEAVSLRRAGYEVHYILASDKNEKGITKEGINYIKIERKLYSKNRYLNFLIKAIMPGGLYNQMLKAASSVKAEVYHLHDLKVNSIGLKLKRLAWNPKVIYDVHEPYPENIIDYNFTWRIATPIKKLYSEYIRRWENRHAAKYDFVITTEENMKERFNKLLPENRVQIIYNYTDLESAESHNNPVEKKWDAIYSGGITRLRGAMKILHAVKLAVREKPDLKVLFLGTCFPEGLKHDMQSFIRQNKLDNKVELHDAVPYNDVAGFYRQSLIGLGIFLPIPTHRIILQIKIFEYLNFGLPIIGSNFGHIGRYIQENKAGITVDPENESEIASAIITLLRNNEMYTEISGNALKASLNYKWHIMEEKLLRIYDQLLDAKID